MSFALIAKRWFQLKQAAEDLNRRRVTAAVFQLRVVAA